MADMDAVTGKLCHFPPIKVQQWQWNRPISNSVAMGSTYL
jgi:hypothetical protein